MSLLLIHPPREEIISLQEAKDYLRVDHNYDDALILNFIKATRGAIESIIKNSVIKRTWRYQINNHAIRNAGCGENIYPSALGDVVRVPLPMPPVLNILKVSIDNIDQPESQYHTEEINYHTCVCIKCKDIIGVRKRSQIVVEYEAGMGVSADTIPQQLKLANLMLVAQAYKDRFTEKTSGIITQGVWQLLQPFQQMRLF